MDREVDLPPGGHPYEGPRGEAGSEGTIPVDCRA
jgi:hypothetical protein